jgi:ABC-2 type transport system permease protein
MWTLIRVGLTNLRRDRVVQALTFLLPIVFFSIFATVFGGRQGGTPRIDVAVVDEDHSEFSQRLAAGLAKESGLRVRATADEKGGGGALTKAAAEDLVQGGDLPVAIVIPAGLGASFASRGFAGGWPSIQLLADVSDPIAPQMVYGLLQKVTMTAAPDLLMKGGLDQFEKNAGRLTAEQRAAVDAWLPLLRQQAQGRQNKTESGAQVARPWAWASRRWM